MCITVNALHYTVCVCVSAEPEGSGFTAGWISIETMANLVFPLEWGNPTGPMQYHSTAPASLQIYLEPFLPNWFLFSVPPTDYIHC